MRLLLEQVPAERLLVVDERPFELALRRTYELGIERSTKWTMTLDADVLLRRGAVAAFVAEAERLPEHYLQIECRVYDKLTGLYRQAGHRIYRTALLRKAMQHIPAPASQLRPEFSVLQEMSRRGHPSRRVGYVVGLHDFEQYYRDLYRKAFIHARKHQAFVPRIVERCLACIESDDDFRVVLNGLYDGITRRDSVSIDTRRFEEILPENWLECLGMKEKAPIVPTELTCATLARECESLLAAEAAPRFDTVDDPPNEEHRLTHWDRYLERVRARGFVKGTVSGVGGGLRLLARRLERVGGLAEGTADIN